MNRAYASSTAAVDSVFWFIAGSAVLLLLLVTGLMVFFAIKYHRSRHPQAKETHESPLLEVLWTLIPTALVMVMFWYGYRAFLTIRAVPADALVVKVTGMMWKWGFEYPNGKKSEVLFVPLNKSIRLNLKSVDVIHGFYIPAFRIKEDVVPGKDNYLWFQPQGMGAADIYCSQFCGLKHAYMLSRVEVLSEADFTAWYISTNTTIAGVLMTPRAMISGNSVTFTRVYSRPRLLAAASACSVRILHLVQPRPRISMTGMVPPTG